MVLVFDLLCFGFLVLFNHKAQAGVISKTPANLPANDSFYNPPSGFPANATIIKDVSAIYELLYRSTNAVCEANVIAVTLWIPAKNRQPDKHLAYSLAYDSSFVNCEPSYAIQAGVGNQYGPLSGTEATAIQSAISAGYCVSTSDYEGKRGAFTNGLQSGRALLDSVRAVRNSGKTTGVSDQVRTVLWGYSGGALASEWASELHQSYAPETKIIGAALGGLTPNVTSVALLVNKTPAVGLVPAGVWGLAAQYPNLTRFVNEALKPEKKAAFEKAKSQCFISNIAQFFNQDMLSYTNKGIGFFTDPVPASIVNLVGIMGKHGVPSFPFFVYKGAKDEISAVEDTDALVRNLCNKGVKIQYNRDKNNGHTNLDKTALGSALAFVRNALDSGIVPTECHTKITSLPIQ